ncbi:unnamed protein product [Lactuca virosa]|uniref:Uncharacterized protein n=1 Tax=Lactuca virosa TaxID=75947 RepID=A0AAU9MMV2_9ASTR|nr:unnamed protein product [Lactuca virosa]
MSSRFEVSRCSLIKLSLPIEFESTASILLQFCPDLELIHGSVFDFVAIALGDLKLCYEKRSQRQSYSVIDVRQPSLPLRNSVVVISTADIEVGNSDFLSHSNQLTAISATWLFCSAIPTLLAFKRAAESLEKLLDITREELPDTMADVRLSGMEISDLTMELSDLGQEITQGVKSSIRASYTQGLNILTTYVGVLPP